jgi:hypothetical protein
MENDNWVSLTTISLLTKECASECGKLSKLIPRRSRNSDLGAGTRDWSEI